ncbi:transcriptional regulator with XRE-family HTH domain [Kitasatospora sp. GAS204A]|uniref:helix-turn-helix domain-containing protein n=1 Tax=unclassified Kitasatospora TaxID=2633591 RepID=UPI002473FE05|nr:helix-turn-helix transcriptional regulator [Kitasatospora sp. GAS204B]MDH6122030.1 transcriptional regulator with XRE-family HTH domain [Kitasatospora sp. GAS204B]
MDGDRIRVRRTPPPELGPMLGSARLRAGYRVREFARLVELSHSYLLHLEAGTRCPSVTVARRIAEALELTEGEWALLFAAAVDDAGRDHPARGAA